MTEQSLLDRAEIERRYDGPYPEELALPAEELILRRLGEASAARRFHAGRARDAIRFARRHLAGGRPDLARLMLDDARAERHRSNAWRRRGLALMGDTGPGGMAGNPK